MQTGQKVWRVGEEAEARTWAHPTHLSAALRYMSVCERDNRQARHVGLQTGELLCGSRAVASPLLPIANQAPGHTHYLSYLVA